MTPPRAHSSGRQPAGDGLPELPIAARALQVAQNALTQIESHERECLRRWDKIEERLEKSADAFAEGLKALRADIAAQSKDSSEKRAAMHDKIGSLRNWVVGLVITGLSTTLLLTLGLVGFLLKTYALH